MSCGHESEIEKTFTTVGQIFFRSSDSGKQIDIPKGADDSAQCLTPRLRSVDGEDVLTVIQLCDAVNLNIWATKRGNPAGRKQAEKDLRYYGATDDDIKNLLG